MSENYKKLMALSDPEIVKEFYRKKPDVAKLRAKAIKKIDVALDQFGGGSARGRRIFKVDEGRGSAILDLSFVQQGIEEQGYPLERFHEALTLTRAAISDGFWDASMVEMAEGVSDNTDTPSQKPQKVKGTRKPWPPGERERRAAARAARKAAEAQS